jgi:hypothetical protein
MPSKSNSTNLKRSRQTISSSSTTSNVNPLTIAQFQETLATLFPNITFSRGAVDALRCVQEDFVDWIATTTAAAADEATKVSCSNNVIAGTRSLKPQDILKALSQDPSLVLTTIADQMPEILMGSDKSNNVAAESIGPDAGSSKRVASISRQNRKAKKGRHAFSEEMEAAQEQLLQGSKQKMTETNPSHPNG